MSDLISRPAAIDALDKHCDNVCQYSKKQRSVMCGACPLGTAFDVIEQQPTIEAEPVKHGRWIEKENLVLCSKCGRPTEDRHDAIKEFNGHRVIARVYPYYCGFCGAKMDEVEDDLS